MGKRGGGGGGLNFNKQRFSSRRAAHASDIRLVSKPFE